MRRLALLLTFFFLGTTLSHADQWQWRQHERWPDADERTLTVFDANGHAVGQLESYGSADGVYLDINGALVFAPLTLANVNFATAQSAQYQWAAPGLPNACGSAPVISPDSGPRPSVAARSGDDVTLYIAADANSIPCASSTSLSTYPVESTYALSAHYPEPLTIRVNADDDAHPARHDDDRTPMVFDAQGRPVGPLESYMRATGVFLVIDGAPVFVQVGHKLVGSAQYSASQFEWTGFFDVPYTSGNCSAGLLVDDTGSPTPAMAVRNSVDVTLYIAGRVPSIDATVGSFRLTNLAGMTSCDPASQSTSNLWTVKHAYPLTQHYPEPLRIAY